MISLEIAAFIIATVIIILIYFLRPQNLAETTRLLTMQVRELAKELRAQQAESAANRGEIRQLEMRIFDAVRLISQLSEGIRELTKQILDDGGTPVWEPPTDAKLLILHPDKSRVRRVETRLSQNFGEYFSEDDLRSIALDLGADFENLPGSIKQAKARELVLWAKQRNRLRELAMMGKEARPFLDWTII